MPGYLPCHPSQRHWSVPSSVAPWTPHEEIVRSHRPANRRLQHPTRPGTACHVYDYQQRNKAYSDKRRAAREPKFKVGAYMWVKPPLPGMKGTPSFGAPLKILKRIGRWLFHLEDGRTWNASGIVRCAPQSCSRRNGETKIPAGGHAHDHASRQRQNSDTVLRNTNA